MAAEPKRIIIAGPQEPIDQKVCLRRGCSNPPKWVPNLTLHPPSWFPGLVMNARLDEIRLCDRCKSNAVIGTILSDETWRMIQKRAMANGRIPPERKLTELRWEEITK